MTIVEAFEVDLVGVDMRSKIFEDARRPVAVRDKRGRKSLSSRVAKDCDGPFHRDERLVVRGDHELRTLAQRILDERLRRGVPRWRAGVRITKRLRRDPVLAVAAVEIAAEHTEAVGERTRVYVKERLFLDRIALHAADVPPWRVQRSAPVESNLAHTDGTVRNTALMTARVTANGVLGCGRGVR